MSLFSKQNVEGHSDLKACTDLECSRHDGVVSPPVEDNEVCVCGSCFGHTLSSLLNVFLVHIVGVGGGGGFSMTVVRAQ